VLVGMERLILFRNEQSCSAVKENETLSVPLDYLLTSLHIFLAKDTITSKDEAGKACLDKYPCSTDIHLNGCVQCLWYTEFDLVPDEK
jgi:hypothetical protein